MPGDESKARPQSDSMPGGEPSAMAAKESLDFDGWLTELLNSLDVDGEVYSGYISGTLTTLEGTEEEEVEEAMVNILSACLVG